MKKESLANFGRAGAGAFIFLTHDVGTLAGAELAWKNIHQLEFIMRYIFALNEAGFMRDVAGAETLAIAALAIAAKISLTQFGNERRQITEMQNNPSI